MPGKEEERKDQLPTFTSTKFPLKKFIFFFFVNTKKKRAISGDFNARRTQSVWGGGGVSLKNANNIYGFGSLQTLVNV